MLPSTAASPLNYRWTHSLSIVRELVEKAPKVVPGSDWQVHYAFFARAGFTDAARVKGERMGAQLVDLMVLDRDLRR